MGYFNNFTISVEIPVKIIDDVIDTTYVIGSNVRFCCVIGS